MKNPPPVLLEMIETLSENEVRGSLGRAQRIPSEFCLFDLDP